MEQEITNGIHAEKFYQLIGIEHVSFRFTHLAIALKQPRMTKYLFW